MFNASRKIIIATLLGTTLFAGVAIAQDKDEAAVRQTIQKLQDGWDQKSGQTYATAFAEPHDHIVYGNTMEGLSREDTADQMQGLYDGAYRSSTVSLTIRSIKFLSGENAMVNLAGEMTTASDSGESHSFVTIAALLQKKGSEWQIIHFNLSETQKLEE